MTKISLNNVPYRKLLLDSKQHSKTVKEHVLMKNVFLIRFDHTFILKGYLQNIKSVQKQPFADVLQNRCSRQFCRIHRKTRSTFNKVAGLRKLHCKCFLMIFAKFSRTPNKTLYTIKVNYPVPDKIMISKSDTIIQVLCERYIIANQQGIVFPAHLFC